MTLEKKNQPRLCPPMAPPAILSSDRPFSHGFYRTWPTHLPLRWPPATPIAQDRVAVNPGKNENEAPYLPDRSRHSGSVLRPLMAMLATAANAAADRLCRCSDAQRTNQEGMAERKTVCTCGGSRGAEHQQRRVARVLCSRDEPLLCGAANESSATAATMFVATRRDQDPQRALL